MSTLIELARIREDLGLAPVGSLLYLGIGFTPPKQNAIRIDPDSLPTLRECHAVAGLDVVMVFRGHDVRYSTIRSLTDTLFRSCPRRLQLVDLDYKRIAFLKLAGL
jgi:hypothetical protein